MCLIWISEEELVWRTKHYIWGTNYQNFHI